MRSLERLLRPKTLAVFGGGHAEAVVRQSLKMGFAGKIWPVHPAKEEVAGLKAYRCVAELPAAPDAAFVGVNRHLSLDIVRDLAGRGAGGVVCFAAGFAEAGEDGLQAKLVAAAGAMPLIGPNCYGLINYADGALLWPDQHGGVRLPAGACGAAILTQSSNIAINLTMQRRGLPLAFVMTAGNQAQIGLSELALALVEDERVSVLGLHIEGFDQVAGFERLAQRARELKKPVVAMKVGRSEQARAATVSHTASLAGSDAASDAFLTRLGIARVHSIPSFLETLKLLHVAGPLGGRSLSSMSCSGGEASVMADAAVDRRVAFPSLDAAHRAKVSETLGPLVTVANPLDYHTFIWNNEPAMRSAFTAFVSGGFDLNLLVLDFPRADRCSDADWWPTLSAFRDALAAHSAKGAVVASMPENLPEEHCARLMEMDIAPLCGIAEALDAAEAAAFVGEAWQRPFPSPLRGGWPDLVRPGGVGDEARNLALNGSSRSEASIDDPTRPLRGHPALEGEGAPLSEADAKALLAQAGLPVPPGRRAASVDEAVEAARTLGFSVALKALGLAHKSDHGAVRLNLHDEAALRAAAAELLPLGSGLYVEKMIESGVAELIVGITRDPVFGPVMTVGSGGVLVELLKDSATLLLPTFRSEVEAALRGLKLFPLLDGYRGRPRADLNAAVEAVLGIAAFALAHAGTLEELDINPLIVCAEGKGAWIADALMVPSLPPEGRVRPKAGSGVADHARNLEQPHPPPPEQVRGRHPPLKGEGDDAAKDKSKCPT